MHQTRHIIFALGFHRHHIAPLADGNDWLPEEFTVGGRGNHLLQTVPNLAGLNAHMAADVRQLRGSGVRNLLLGENGAQNSIFQIFVGCQRTEQLIQNGFLVVLRNVALDAAGAAQNAADLQQLLGLQASSSICPLQAG